MLHYLEDTSAERASNAQLQEIDKMVQKVKRKEETGVAYMQLYEYVQREAWAMARESRAEGKAEDILLLLEEKDNVPSELKEKIMSEKDEEKLRQWLKVAAQSDSIESFRKKVML